MKTRLCYLRKMKYHLHIGTINIEGKPTQKSQVHELNTGCSTVKSANACTVEKTHFEHY